MKSHPVLSRLGETGVKLGLDRVRQLLAELGDPHLAAPVVHVAGTNGKGSVCAYVTQALVAAGLRVGTYTSPHLEHVNERVQLDGAPIDDLTLTEAIEALDRMRGEWGSALGFGRDVITYFELMTVVAFQVFAARRVDVAVVEVGMGGRLDATNVVLPVATAITSIAMDHTEVLGDTLGAIAAEKAGILKGGVPCAVGPVPAEALDVIRRRAEQVGAPLWLSGAHLRRERRGGAWSITTPEGQVGPVTLGMPGAHQGANAAVAVGVLHLLKRQGFPIGPDAVAAGLARARV
ncbi:MAG TPA: Mur ligase family protein, partial [Myxococcota bacterium]|nr:Mur ligase family protein [Myxococcota bacterium]